MLQQLIQPLQAAASYLGYSKACPLCDATLANFQQCICDECYQTLPWSIATPQLSATPLISAFTYASPIKQLILDGKTSQHLDKIQLLASLLQQRFSELITELPEAILPIPLHPKRLRQRGFNQAVELVRPLAKQLGVPLILKAVIRKRHTDEQKKLAAIDRHSNLHQAFQLVRPIPYKHVAIFDDVVTTGATCAELELLLTDYGVEKIQIWCCAQTKMT